VAAEREQTPTQAEPSLQFATCPQQKPTNSKENSQLAYRLRPDKVCVLSDRRQQIGFAFPYHLCPHPCTLAQRRLLLCQQVASALLPSLALSITK